MALVITLRAFVPTGYMIGTSGEDGRVILEICNGQTAGYLVLDTETGQATPIEELGAGQMDQHDGGEDPGGSCPFALSATVSLDGLATDPVPPVYARPGHDLPQSDDAHRPNLSRAPPPARAPPFLV